MVSGRSRGAQKGRPKVNITAKRIKGVACLVLIKGRGGGNTSGSSDLTFFSINWGEALSLDPSSYFTKTSYTKHSIFHDLRKFKTVALLHSKTTRIHLTFFPQNVSINYLIPAVCV